MRAGEDDWAARRELDDREHAARRQVISTYLAADAAGLAWAVIDKEGFEAIAELRRVNEVLKEHGFRGPLGAAGVRDVFIHMGEIQFHEGEIPVLLIMVRNFMAAAGQLGITLAEDSEQLARSIIDRLEAAGGADEE